MRITHEMLLKFAQEAVEQQIKLDRNLLAACLVGSVMTEEPLIAGSTDIDLILIHPVAPPVKREIQRILDEVSLDIYHYDQAVFFQPRHLRLDPWLGPTLQNHPKILHDTRHWFELIQASVGAQFYRPDFCLARSHSFLDRAREIWNEIQVSEDELPRLVACYLEAVENGANAIACLSGPPLTIRRFLPNFLERVQAVEKPGLMTGLSSLISFGETDPATLHSWLDFWNAAFEAASHRSGQADPELQPARKHYLYNPLESLLESDQPAAVLWPLLLTWTRAVQSLPRTTVHHQPWGEAMTSLHLDLDHLPERMKALDAYLDTVDETLDEWALKNGA